MDKIIKIINPDTIKGKLRLEIIPRWSLVRMAKTQSVAEHSYGVAVICKGICDHIGMSHFKTAEIVVSAIEHDQDEVITSDIPNTLSEGKPTNNPILKLADNIEALVFVNNYCIDTLEIRDWLKRGLTNKINFYSGLVCERYSINIWRIEEFTGEFL